MKAFHNDPAIKQKYVDRVQMHIDADNLIRGEGWTGEKGCAVGCTLERYEHARYETELGIPEWLARVEDTLFEGMTEKKSQTWPKVFLEAITPGVDLDQIKVPFTAMILEHTLKSMSSTKFDAKKWPEVARAIEGSKAAVEQMIGAQKSGDKEKISAAYSAARSAAYSAAYSADSAAYSARSAAYSARSAAYSARSAADSAYSAAYSARSAADSAYSAAYSARSAAYSARSAAYSARSARSAAYDYYADELLKLLKAAK